MKLTSPAARPGTRGSILILVFIFLSVGLIVLVAALKWTQTSTRLTARNNQHFRTLAAAEAATEKVLSRMSRDYQSGSESLVFASLETYRELVPTPAESGVWSDYEFTDHYGDAERTQVQFVPPSEYRVLASQYRGLHGYASAFRVGGYARELNGRFSIRTGIQQDIEIATIPLFQYAIFYNADLEINPGPNMTITGPVHCNTNIYCQPQATLIFGDDITASGTITHNKSPNDPTSRTLGTITYQAEHDAGVSTLNMPIGTNNSPAAVREVIEPPPSGESPTSPMGKERFYNKVDLIVTVTDTGTTVTSGRADNHATTVPSSQFNQFIDTTVTFFNKREDKTIKTVQIDVAKFVQWNASNTIFRSWLPTVDLRSIYVVDKRTQTSSTQSGVRLVNGQTLPPKGLTIASPNPIYIRGHYNAPSGALGTTNTSATVPAALMGDAVTVLSTAWSDANASSSLGSRVAAHTTVNAAFLAGIVPSTSASYSGGVENYPRFLESWSGRTFTYNGSMVVMYQSKYATNLWRGTGSTIGIYNPPNRNWAFDQNFRDPNKLPPACPAVRVLIRGGWKMVKG